MSHPLRGVVAASALLAMHATATAGTLYLARLNAANENPPTNSTATGSGALILNNAETQSIVTATHNVVGVTAGHIHRAAVGVNGPVIFPFTAPGSPVGPLVWNMSANAVTWLKGQELYMNFHTPANPTGEIRGQLLRAWLAPAATTAAQTRLANALDVSAGYDASLDQILIATNLASLDVQTRTLDELAARTVYTQARSENEIMASLANSLFAYADEARLNPVTPAGQFSAFFRAGDGLGQRSATANQAGSSISRPFIVAGVDYRFTETSRGGFALGYSDARDSFDGGIGKTKTQTLSLQAFVSTVLGDSGVALDGVAGYGWGDIDSTRVLPVLGRTATASPDAHVWSAALKASKAYPLSNGSTLVPYASIDAQNASVSAYGEEGAGTAGLLIPRLTSWNSALEGGAALFIPIKLESGTLTARLQAGWHYQFEDGADTFSTQLIGSPVAFETEIEGLSKSSARVEASLTAQMTDGVFGTLGYSGLLGGGGQTQHVIEARLVIKL